jgi:hypothetical protein
MVTEGVAAIGVEWSRAPWFDCTRDDNKLAPVWRGVRRGTGQRQLLERPPILCETLPVYYARRRNPRHIHIVLEIGDLDTPGDLILLDAADVMIVVLAALFGQAFHRIYDTLRIAQAPQALGGIARLLKDIVQRADDLVVCGIQERDDTQHMLDIGLARLIALAVMHLSRKPDGIS